MNLCALAESLAARHFPTGPVDPAVIARAEGLTILHTPFQEEIDGLLLHVDGRPAIVCNSRRTPPDSPRDRFTIAHELGHYFARQFNTARVPGRPRPGEHHADRFAAHLLLPTDSFSSAFRAAEGSGLNRLALLASAFGTSFTATAYRAIDLDLFTAPSAVLLWDVLGQRIGRRVSPDTLELDSHFIDLAETPPPNSASAHAIHSLAYDLRTGRIPAMRWFTSILGDEEEHHLDLHEEVLPRGGHGWITLLNSAGA